jgi:hypothetical protein
VKPGTLNLVNYRAYQSPADDNPSRQNPARTFQDPRRAMTLYEAMFPNSISLYYILFYYISFFFFCPKKIEKEIIVIYIKRE